MKTSISLLALFIALTVSDKGIAQNHSSDIPKYVSEKGYWVVESNINDRKNHVIWFYNTDNVVVYKETVTGVKLNSSRKKVRMKLKNVLETAVTAWERSNDGKYPQDQGLVKTQF